jgi:hypothetical protein
MKQINFKDPFSRKTNYDIEIDQMECIRELYLKGETNNDITRVLKQKYSSYKNQDKQSHKYDSDQHITFEQMIEKIYTCDLKCYYCNCDLDILYNKKKLKTQWTLERLDNNLGHYASNTCISCLECNLKRRTDNYEYFKQSKQTRIIKLE